MSNHSVTILNAADGIDSIAEPINQWIDLSNGVMQRRFGHDDYDETAEVLTAALSQQEQANKWLALVTDADGRVVGGSFARRSKYENPTILDELEIIVEESARGRGVGAAVQAGLEQLAAEQGCRTLRGWATHDMAADQNDAEQLLMPKEGPFGVRRDDPITRFALRHGYRLAQTERHSIQQVADPRGVTGPELAEGYRFHRWAEFTPEQWHQDMCALHLAMSQDVPKGELEEEDAQWTPERLVEAEQGLAQRRQRLIVAAEHVDSGRLAAFTEVTKYPTATGAAYQGDTIVTRDHRGHRLGHSLKVENLRQVREAWPQTQRIHTWNAGENDHMWSINESLGYETSDVTGAWVKKLD